MSKKHEHRSDHREARPDEPAYDTVAQRRRRRAATCGSFLAVVALGLAVRVVAWWELRDLALLRYPLGDARVYLEWAERIASGDLASSFTGVFYQPPLYPYLLAASRWLTGGADWAPRLGGVLLGSLTCGLLALGTSRWFGRRAGVVAGVMAAFLPTAVFYDLMIDKAGATAAGAAALVVLLAPPRGRRRWIAAGAVLGLVSLLRENALLLAPVLAALALFDCRRTRSPARRLRVAAWFVAAFAAVLAPVVVRNAVVGGEPALTTSQSGANFFIGNRRGADGSYRPLRPGRSDTPLEQTDARELAERAAGRTLSPREVSRFWWTSAFGEIRGEPAAWLRLTAKKLLLTVHAHELPDTVDLRLLQAESVVLGAGRSFGLHFGLLVPLAAAGAAWSWRRRRIWWPLTAVGGLYAASVAAFFVFGRYRHPLVAVVVPFAAAGLVGLAHALRLRRWRRVAAVALPCLALAVAVNRPLAMAGPRSLAMGWSNQGAAEAGLGRLDAAAASYRRAIELDADLAEARLNLGSMLLISGQPGEAAVQLGAARRLLGEPDPEVEWQWALALAEAGRLDEAVVAARSAASLEAPSGGIAGRLAAALGRAGRWADAVAVVDLRRDDDPGAALVAAKLRLLSEDPRLRDPAAAAAGAAFAARSSGWTDQEAVTVAARAWLEAGRPDRAREVIEAALPAAREPRWRGQLLEWRARLSAADPRAAAPPPAGGGG